MPWMAPCLVQNTSFLGSAAPSSVVKLSLRDLRGKKDPEREVALFFADTQLLTLPSCLLL